MQFYFTLVVWWEKHISPNLTNSQEPEPQHVFGPLKPEPPREKIRSRSHLEKKSGAEAAKKLPGSSALILRVEFKKKNIELPQSVKKISENIFQKLNGIIAIIISSESKIFKNIRLTKSKNLCYVVFACAKFKYFLFENPQNSHMQPCFRLPHLLIKQCETTFQALHTHRQLISIALVHSTITEQRGRRHTRDVIVHYTISLQIPQYISIQRNKEGNTL